MAREPGPTQPTGTPAGRVFDALLLLAAGLSAAILMAMALVIGWAVISRKWLGNPLAWNVELSEYALLYVTFLATTWVLRQDAHVRVDLVVNLLPAAVQRVLNRLADLVGAAVCGLLSWYTYQATADGYREGLLLIKSIIVPKWTVMAVIPVGFLLLTLQFTRNLFGPSRDAAG